MPQPHTPPPLSYLRLRWRWSAQALREWLWRRRRQAGVLAALLAGCAGDLPSAWASLQSVLVFSVWPLARWSSAGHLTPWLGGLLLQTTLGALQALALFPWLWRPAWRTQDNALPLSPATRWRADALLVGLTQLPWVLAQMAGGLLLLAQQPAWLTGPARGLWLTGLVLAQGLAVLAGTAGLARWRQAPRGRWPQGVARRSAVSAHRPALRWQRALLWLPLWAGAAVLLEVLPAGPLPLASWRPGVLAAWALWMLPALWWQTAPASPDPVARTSAGLLGLLLGLALASDALKESPR